MTPILQTAFMQALGYAIVSSLWQFAFLWLAYVLYNNVVRLSPHQKYVAGVVLQLTGFAWFVVTIITYNRSGAFNPLIVLHRNENIAGQKLSVVAESLLQLLPWLSAGYVLLLLFLILRWMIGYKQSRIMRSTALEKAPPEWRLFAERIAKQMGIKKKVEIFISAKITTPLTLGFLKPLILLPLAGINNLSSEQIEAVIVHELAHIRRSDYLCNLVLSVVKIAVYFNPFMHLLNKNIQSERENCCDDWVLQYQYSPTLYARALLQIATNPTIAPAFALHFAENNNQLLLHRILRIIERREKKLFDFRYRILTLLITMFVFGVVPMVLPMHEHNNEALLTSNPLIQPLFSRVSDNNIVKSATVLASIKALGISKMIDEKEMNRRFKATQFSMTLIKSNTTKVVAAAPTYKSINKGSVFITTENSEPVKLRNGMNDNTEPLDAQVVLNEGNALENLSENDIAVQKIKVHVPQLKELTANEFQKLLQQMKAATDAAKQSAFLSNSGSHVNFKFEVPDSNYSLILKNGLFTYANEHSPSNAQQSDLSKLKSHTILIIVTNDEDGIEDAKFSLQTQEGRGLKKIIRL